MTMKIKKIGEWVLCALYVAAVLAGTYAFIVWAMDWEWNILEWPTWWWVAMVTGLVLFIGLCLTKENSILHKLFGGLLMAYLVVGFFAKIFFMVYIPYNISGGSWTWAIVGFVIFAILGTVGLITRNK